MNRNAIVVFTLLVGLGAIVLAEEPETIGVGDEKRLAQKGYSQDQLYFAIGGAEVNSFNFNLVMSLSEQVGFAMPVDGGLNIRLSRVYNSNLYSMKTWTRHNECNPPSGRPTTQLKYLSIPRQNPMGLGWEFHLGRIYRKEDVYPKGAVMVADCRQPGEGHDNDLAEEGNWTYRSPDGSDHQLLRHDDESDAATTAAGTAVNVYYSRDGSTLKAIQYVAGDYWELYFPDGRILEMKWRVDGNMIDERFFDLSEESYCQNDVTQMCSAQYPCPLAACTLTDCHDDPACNSGICENMATLCGRCLSDNSVWCDGDDDCPDGWCLEDDPIHTCRTHEACTVGECTPVPTCYPDRCDNDIDAYCDTVGDCPPGYCAEDPCDEDADCQSNECGNRECVSLTTNIQPAQPTEPPYLYDRDKIGYHTTRIRGRETDSSGDPEAYIDIEYHSPPFDYILRRITDSHTTGSNGREIVVRIEETETGSANYGHVVEIEYPSPPKLNGDPQAPAVFQYGYSEITLPFVAGDRQVDVLTSVDMPYDYGFRYDYRTGGLFEILVTEGTPDFGGQLNRIDYPSGKSVTLTYTKHFRTDFVQRQDEDRMTRILECGCADKMSVSPFIGLAGKEEWLDYFSDPEPYRTWEFGIPSGYPNEFNDDPGADECNLPYTCLTETAIQNSRSWMIDPAGNKTVLTFDTSSRFFRDLPQESVFYGLPLGEKQYERVSEDPPSFELLKQTDKEHTSVYHNQTHNVIWTAQTSETVTYLDDDPAVGYNPTLHTMFTDPVSGFGYHRFETTEIGGSAIGKITEYGGADYYTRYTTRDYLIDNAGCVGDDAYKNWLPNAIVSESSGVKEGEAAHPLEVTEYVVHLSGEHAGRISDRIQRATIGTPGTCYADIGDVSLNAGDVVMHFDYHDDGNLEKQGVRHGGDTVAQFWTEYEVYSYGVPERVRRGGMDYSSDPQNPQAATLPYRDSWVEVDAASSIVGREEVGGTTWGDSQAVYKVTEYDKLRRPKIEQIGDDKPWCIDYVDEQLADGRWRLASATIWQLDTGTCEQGTVYTSTTEYYDRAGRVFKTRKLNPDDTWAYQHTCYNEAGLVEFVSEWTTVETLADCQDPGVPGTTTSYVTSRGGQDPFGRPWRVEGPLEVDEGVNEATEYEYFGTNKQTTVNHVAGLEEGTPPPDLHLEAVTTFYTDGLDRLRAVDAGFNAPVGKTPSQSPAADALYEYDHAGRLTEVNLADGLAEAPQADDRFNFVLSNPQTRAFTYDALGRQTSSTHPESGTTTVTEWNALGSPVEVQDEMGYQLDHAHRTVYDGVGRPIRLERVVTGTTFDDTIPAAAGAWTETGIWNTANSVTCAGESGWYIGDSNCRYAVSEQQSGTLTATTAAAVPDGSHLSFRYFREVREDLASGDDQDKLRVFVAVAGSEAWQEVFALDSTQVSWSTWKRSPAIPIPNDLAGNQLDVKFEFDSGQDPTGATVVKGIAIGEVAIRKRPVTVLQTYGYDQDFGEPDNRCRGKLTSVATYDEATFDPVAFDAGTLTPSYSREFLYVQEEGRLSEEEIRIDWDRTGDQELFRAAYGYDSFGLLETEVMPHYHLEESPLTYTYGYAHGALVEIEAASDNSFRIIPHDPVTPGIEYNLAGGMSVIRYGNDSTTTIDVNAAFLPSRIHAVDQSGGDIFDTGSYEYDGARNIKAIGPDSYRYDTAGRLRQAVVHDTDGASPIQLDYEFDPYGNMTARRTRIYPSGDEAALGPEGLYFPGRSYSGNRIDTSIHTGYKYDDNGNLTKEPQYGDFGGFRYSFTPENRMTLVFDEDESDGKVLQESLYNHEGHRWATMTVGRGGRPLLTLRDGSGQLVSEYTQTSSATPPELRKQYVRANGKLVAINTACGPTPALEFVDYGTDEIYLEKTDYITATGDYTILIESASGATNTVPLDQASPDIFTLSESELFAGENNWIRIRAQAECGQTGYSNGVSYYRDEPPDPPDPPCLDRMTISQRSFEDLGGGLGIRGVWDLAAIDQGCPPGRTYRAYYLAEGAAPEKAVLLAEGLTTAYLEMLDVPVGAGHGEYWFVEWNSKTQQETGFSPRAVSNSMNSGGGSEQIPGFPSITPQYVHWDHLGSTRAVTDDEGQVLSKQKYYPFGHYVEGSDAGDTRLKFTGHERDEKLMLDYMLARYYGANLGRFLSIDPLRESARLSLPQSWNRYSYAWNNPILLMDPDGQAVQLMGKTTEDRQKELDAIGESLDDEEAADKLYVNEEGVDEDGNTVWNDPDATPTGRYFVGVQGELGDFAKSSPVASQLADVVGHKEIVGFSITNKDLSSTGGAHTLAAFSFRNRTGNPLVEINPAQLHLAKGPRQDIKTATAHELYGHGLGIIHKAFDPGTLGGTNSYAIQQENIARKWYSRKAPGSYPPADRHY